MYNIVYATIETIYNKIVINIEYSIVYKCQIIRNNKSPVLYADTKCIS